MKRVSSFTASSRSVAALALFGGVLLAGQARAERVTVPLDGPWQIDESVLPDAMPRSFAHTVPVPGLANLAEPPFRDVDLFESRELIAKRIRLKTLPESARVEGVGISRQERNYFWYQKVFPLPVRKAVARLKINKAQFGTAVWLNGRKLGEHFGCFSAGYFDASGAVNWQGENRLVVRIGAHPGALPASVPAGTDSEKNRWTPGIYDSVSLLLGDNPVIESVQVAPRIQSAEIVVQTRLKNYGPACSCALEQVVATSADGREVARPAPRPVSLAGGEETTLTQTIPIPHPTLWSPENPFLYRLETGTGGDWSATRFGMREFRFDTATRRALLNGKVYFLRGSNITLHRFFEDPRCGSLPWDEQWVRKLLAEIPKRMHWNSFRFCIGPVPDRWLEIADETGLLIQNEFFIWTGGNPADFPKEWDAQELIRQYGQWMRDNWNHPSVVVWDACNETLAEILGRDVIPAVRGLDLSNRPWENGYNPPAGPDDPVENHPYEGFNRPPFFQVSELEKMDGSKLGGNTPPTGHPIIINEYGWLWLNRDGTPTELTREIYPRLVGPDATAEQRFAMNAYLLGGLTEFWRAYRNAAAVLHFVYLTSSYPGAYTSDHFRDIEKLELEPHFADYVGEAFKPLGVYLRFWQPSLTADSDRRIAVMMVNDEQTPLEGSLVLSLEAADGAEAARCQRAFALAPLGQQTYYLNLHVPDLAGKYVLKATALPRQPQPAGNTISRRNVQVVRKSR